MDWQPALAKLRGATSPPMLTTPSMATLGEELAEEVGVVARTWQATQDHPHLQAQVAAAALTYFFHQTPSWLELIHNDTQAQG